MRIKIVYSPNFRRKIVKLIRKKPGILSLLENAVTLLMQYPAATSLKIHKLNGELNNKWALSLSHDLRIIFSKGEKNTVRFLDIGSHDDVY